MHSLSAGDGFPARVELLERLLGLARGGRWTWRRSAGRSRPAGRRARSPARPARPRPPRSAPPASCARACSFLERFGAPRGLGGAGLATPAWPAWRCARPPRAPRAPARTRASRRRRSAASGPPARRSACRRRRAARGRGRSAAARPGSSAAPSSSASRLSRSRWLVGSSRIRTLAPEWTRIASDSRWRSPPDSPSSGFSASSPLNRKLPEQRPRVVGRQLRSRAGRPRAPCAPLPSLVGVLREQPELDVVAACAACRRRARAPPASAVISVVLPEPLAPTSDTCSAALEPQLGVLQQHPVADLQQPVLDLEHDAAGALRRLEGEAERLAVARVASEPLDLVELLLARLAPGARACPRGSGSTKRSSLAISACCFSIARPRASSRCAFSAPPGVPGALEELRRARPRAPARRCPRPPGTSGRAPRARSPRPATAGASPATPATRCPGGWWARRAAAGRDRPPAPAPARRGSARRRRTSPASGPGARRGTRARAASS